MTNRIRWNAGMVLGLAGVMMGCDSVTPPPSPPPPNGPAPVIKLEIQSPPTLLTFPGEGRANLIIKSDENWVQDSVTPTLSITGPFTATWESLRWQLRTLKVVATGVGSGAVTITALGKSASFNVAATAVRFARVASDRFNGCGIALDGGAWCWGGNDSRQLGTSTPSQCAGSVCQYGGIYPSVSPVKVETEQKFAQIAVGNAGCGSFIAATCGRTCGLTATGEAWCWGNGFGPPMRAAPEMTFTSIAVRTMTSTPDSCGLAADGKAYCFNSTGTTAFGNGMSFSTLMLGEQTCGVSSGDVWCWGPNYYGMLGIGNSDGKSYATPQRVTTTGHFVALDGDYYATCALDDTGVIYCWGTNYDAAGVSPPSVCSQSATNLCQTTPRRLEGGGSYVSIAFKMTGSAGVCGLTASGAVDCWLAFNKPPSSLVLPEPLTSLSRSCGISASNVMYCWDMHGAVRKIAQ